MTFSALPDILDEIGQVELALFTTFGFDPLFFEECLLRTRALSTAERIVVMADARELSSLESPIQRPPRWLNQRYLVAPMHAPGHGVFHPKLALLLGKDHALLLCGSANLTLAGCTRNLELINAFRFDLTVDPPSVHLPLVAQALSFFRSCLPLTTEGIQAILSEWIPSPKTEPPGPIHLVHTLAGRLWDQIKAPDALTIISPFYDLDLGLVKRAQKQWPKCAINLIAQQHTSLLPTRMLATMPSVRLHEVRGEERRRLHAKLCVVTHGNKARVIAGSANFTQAAFDSRNVEACLIWDTEQDVVKGLFGKGLNIYPIAPDDFEPGEAAAPEDNAPSTALGPLAIQSARLDADNVLKIDFQRPSGSLDGLVADIIDPAAGAEPIKCIKLSLGSDGQARCAFQNSEGSGGALQVRLRMPDLSGGCAWIIQESTLTRRFDSQGSLSPREAIIQESGQGLTEFLDHLGATKGQEAVIAYLEQLNIRFHSESGVFKSKGRFSLAAHDPHRTDKGAAWLAEAALDAESKSRMRTSILDFVERHEWRVIHAHAKKGNLNGIPNLLDVLRTCIKMLYLYWERDCVNRHDVVFHCKRCLELLGLGSEEEGTYGFIETLKDSFDGDLKYARETLAAHNYVSTSWVVLTVARRVRAELPRRSGRSPYPLDTLRKPLVTAFAKIGITEKPSLDEMARALDTFEMLTEDEAHIWAIGT